MPFLSPNQQRQSTEGIVKALKAFMLITCQEDEGKKN